MRGGPIVQEDIRLPLLANHPGEIFLHAHNVLQLKNKKDITWLFYTLYINMLANNAL